MESALYLGSVRHRRFRPVDHEFEYPIFMSFIDIDRIPETMAVSRLAGHNRWNWTSFDDRDYFGDTAKPLRERVEDDAKAHGVTLPDGQIFLLTHLRYLGYVFNPVCFFYCYDRANQLRAVLAAVSNTFGETHNYWLTPACQVANGKGHSFAFAKAFHVSPFIGMEGDYRFTFTEPAESLVIQTNLSTVEGALFDASVKLERTPWSAPNLRRVLLRYPFMTLRVVAGIHWEALKLVLRKVPIFKHPGAGLFRPANRKSIGASWKGH